MGDRKKKKKKQATKWPEKSTLKLLQDFISPQTEQSRSRKVVTAITVEDVGNAGGPHSLLVRLQVYTVPMEINLKVERFFFFFF